MPHLLPHSLLLLVLVLVSQTQRTDAIAPGAAWLNIDSTITGSPRARHEACFVMAKGKAYLFGGRGFKGMDIFDPRTRTWTAGPEPPVQMHHVQCVVRGSRIFVVSSWFSSRPEEENARMYVFNTRRQRWFSRPGLPARRRRGAAASVLFGNRIYVIGGNRGGHGPPAVTLSWVDYYDLSAREWVTDLPDMPIGRDHTGGAVVGNRICIAGGRDGGADNFFAAVEPSVFCLDPTDHTWTREEDIPTPRAGGAVVSTCDGRMLVAGGEGRFSRAFDEVEIFDGSVWTTGPPLVRARHGTGIAVSRCSCGQLFIASGSGARGGRPELTETEVLVPRGVDSSCRAY